MASETQDPVSTAAAVVFEQLSSSGRRIGINALTASVLEENPDLTIEQAYSGIWSEVRAGRAKVIDHSGTSGMIYVQKNFLSGGRVADWTQANDPAVRRLAERLEEIIDDAMGKSGAARRAVQVIALLNDGLVEDLSVALARERGRAVAAYVRESGSHPADIVRRDREEQPRG